MTSATDSALSQDRLQQLWHQGNHTAAVAFLRKAISSKMSLQELALALNFDGVRGHLDTIRLSDILQAVPVYQEPRQTASLSPAPKPQRRRRRTAEEMQSLRDAVLKRLQSAVGPVPTPHLIDVLNNGGHDVDALQLGRVMTALEAEGYILSSRTKPKAWRMKPQGRTSAEPYVIRKSASAESASA